MKSACPLKWEAYFTGAASWTFATLVVPIKVKRFFYKFSGNVRVKPSLPTVLMILPN